MCESAREGLDQIRSAANRARDLTQQVLVFGRRNETSRAVVSLGPIFEQATNLLRSSIPARIDIQLEVAADTPCVEADASLLLQVMVNLGSNSAHAIKDGTGKIEISATTTDLPRRHGASLGNLAPGRYAQISVRDSGAGMDEATIKRIFEPFFTTKSVGEGTGLGLSVVHGIVRSHGGDIVVQSQPQVGTVFDIFLPAATISVEEAPVLGPREDCGGEKGKRILCIDDDEAVAFLLSRLLARQGFLVTTFTDPLEALKAIRMSPDCFDAVISDYNMPLMSGLEVAMAIREINPKVPIALASGFITDELRARSHDMGIRQIIYKPNAVEEYGEVVMRLLDSASDAAN